MRRKNLPDGVSLAGWLFADLLLALVVVTLASGAGRSLGSGEAAADELAGGVTTTETTSTTTTTVKVAGVDPEPHTFEIAGQYTTLLGPDGPAKDAERARIVEEMRTHFKDAGLTSRRVGFVLTFGVHPNPSNGTALADVYNGLLRQAQPDMFKGATMRDFWNASGPTGLARFEVYFMR